jgi:hypothetical protein
MFGGSEVHIFGGVVVREQAIYGVLEREAAQVFVNALQGQIHLLIVGYSLDPFPFFVTKRDAMAAGADAQIPLSFR